MFNEGRPIGENRPEPVGENENSQTTSLQAQKAQPEQPQGLASGFVFFCGWPRYQWLQSFPLPKDLSEEVTLREVLELALRETRGLGPEQFKGGCFLTRHIDDIKDFEKNRCPKGCFYAPKEGEEIWTQNVFWSEVAALHSRYLVIIL